MYPDTPGLFAQACIATCQYTSVFLNSTICFSSKFSFFFLTSHHLKHTDLPSDVPSNPHLYTVLPPASVSSMLFTNTQSKYVSQSSPSSPRPPSRKLHLLLTSSVDIIRTLHSSVYSLVPRTSPHHRNQAFDRYLHPWYQQQKNLETSKPRDDPPTQDPLHLDS